MPWLYRTPRALLPGARGVTRSAVPGLSWGDIRDPAFARRVADDASVVINFVGPFDAYSRELVRACAERGTDDVDVTGEPHFVAWSRAELDAAARRSGARILHAQATESLPAMMLAHYVDRMARLVVRYRMHLPVMSPGSRITAALSC
ncbi:MAG: hypothetical protein AAF602_30485, partial [Myxococcota bacterium]